MPHHLTIPITFVCPDSSILCLGISRVSHDFSLISFGGAEQLQLKYLIPQRVGQFTQRGDATSKEFRPEVVSAGAQLGSGCDTLKPGNWPLQVRSTRRNLVAKMRALRLINFTYDCVLNLRYSYACLSYSSNTPLHF